MKITIIGTGYVGLPTGAGLASLGHDVTCVDCVKDTIETLKAGKVTLYEKGLEELLTSGMTSGHLHFTCSIEKEVVRGAQVIIIAVGTPENLRTGEADLSYLFAAVEQVAKKLEGPAVVAIKSTVPVGTGDEVERFIRKTNPRVQAEIISLPEFLREGYAVHDFFHPKRIVVGTQSEKVRSLIREMYAPLSPAPKMLFVSRRSSELIKYASNAFLAMKIHYINEMADLCEAAGANIHEVSRGMGADTRIGSAFLQPGPGYGGSCFPKDTKALLHMARKHGINLSLVRSTILGNEERRKLMAIKILKSVEDIQRPRIAIWGLAFKEGTDDCRESPAIGIIQYIITHSDATVVAYDPKAMQNAHKLLGDSIKYASNKEAAAQGADMLVILTGWDDFISPDLKKLKMIMNTSRIMDLRFTMSLTGSSF